MPGVPDGVHDVLARLDGPAAVDILIISLSIYWLLLLIRGTTAMTVLRGVGVIFVGAFLLSRVLDLQVLSWILRNSIAGVVIAVAIIFQAEIRRALERIGRTGIRSALRSDQHRHAVDTVVRASVRLAREQHGALIVLERDSAMQQVIDTGIPLDATLSVELLASLFVPTTPLHDGAVIVSGDSVRAAGCTLPLSESELPPGYGTRHRAALGLTESTDAVVVVVSEERGDISLCSNGRMVPALDETRLSRQLHRLFGLEEPDAPAVGSNRSPAAASVERRVP